MLNHKYALIAEQEVRIVQCGVRISVSTLRNTIYDGLHNDHEVEMELDAESSRLPSGYGCGEEEEINQGTSAAKTVEQRRIPGASNVERLINVDTTSVMPTSVSLSSLLPLTVSLQSYHG